MVSLIRTYTAPTDKHHLKVHNLVTLETIIQRKLEMSTCEQALGDHGREKLSFNRKKASTEPGSRRRGHLTITTHLLWFYGFQNKIPTVQIHLQQRHGESKEHDLPEIKEGSGFSGYIELFCVYLVAQVIFV